MTRLDLNLLWRVTSLIAICFYANVYSQKVLLISMDGFRWDYIENASTPNFDQMTRDGSTAKYINNTFVTLTFPCHYTIVTGLYEESHGVVGNMMYDPTYDEYFTMRSMETKWWNEGEPIWITARKHGLRSAVYFWPGSETEIKGFRPNIWMPYDESTPFNERVDTVVEWLRNDSLAIDLALLYFHEPDSTGHVYGPYSAEVRKKVEEMDLLLGSIFDKLHEAGLTDSVNVIVTSDHGMTDIKSNSAIIDLSKYIDLSAIRITVSDEYFAPSMSILPHQWRLKEMYRNLSKVPNMRVFLKDHFIPEHWHYKNNRRILPLLLVAEDGWLITQNAISPTVREKGTHGYDNQLQSMKPIFYAKGPNIQRNLEVEPFSAVDIYPLLCELLGIPPAANNGTLNIVQRMIAVTRSTNSAASDWIILLSFSLVFVISLSGLFILLIYHRKCLKSLACCINKSDEGTKGVYRPLMNLETYPER